MDCRELFIGGYYDYDGDIIKMDSSKLSYILEIGGEYEYNPIPLTEEWLLKFGFQKGKDVLINDYDVYTPFVLKRNNGMDRFFEIRKCGSSYGLCSPWKFYNYKDEQCYGSSPHEDYYVHQLQNLYFALTGEELELK